MRDGRFVASSPEDSGKVLETKHAISEDCSCCLLHYGDTGGAAWDLPRGHIRANS